jgi:translation initiation factor 2 subunit 2
MNFEIFEMEDIQDIQDIQEEDLDQFNLRLKKKKKKKVHEDNEEELKEEDKKDNEEYDYAYLLDRVFKELREKNPDLVSRKKYVMPVLEVLKLGTRKIMFANFNQVVSIMNRNPEHVKSYFASELRSECSIDANSRLIIKGKYGTKQIESILKKYIFEYVCCYMCRNPDTYITRDSLSRVSFLHCNLCKSKRSVNI